MPVERFIVMQQMIDHRRDPGVHEDLVKKKNKTKKTFRKTFSLQRCEDLRLPKGTL